MNNSALIYQDPPPSTKRTTILLAKEMPERYCMRIEGNCLEPIFFDEDPMLIDSKADVSNGDFVAIWRRRDLVKPGEHQIIIKRLIRFDVVNGKWSAIVEMLNPQVWFAIPYRSIEAIHRCVGLVPKNMKRYRVTDEKWLGKREFETRRAIKERKRDEAAA
jgi:hypothetical protein